MQVLGRLFAGVGLVGLMATQASASTISIQATNITSGNGLHYAGLDTHANGNGIYTLGSCAFNSGSNQTICSVIGTYVEVAGSQFNPGATGSFVFRQVWSGNVASPITAVSTTPGGNQLTLGPTTTGTYDSHGAFWDLTLSNGFYGTLDFGAVTQPNPQGGALNWQAFFGTGANAPACTGNPQPSCSVGGVGQTAGSTISGTLNPFNMQITFANDPTPVPEPGTIALLGAGLALVARRLRRARSV